MKRTYYKNTITSFCSIFNSICRKILFSFIVDYWLSILLRLWVRKRNEIVLVDNNNDGFSSPPILRIVVLTVVAPAIGSFLRVFENQ